MSAARISFWRGPFGLPSVLSVVFLLLCMVSLFVTPRFLPGHYQRGDDSEMLPLRVPLEFESNEKETLHATLPIMAQSVHPRAMNILFDDCLEEITLNGVSVAQDRLPTCDYNHPFPLQLDQLQTGLNTLTIRMYNIGGTGRIDPQMSLLDPILFVPRLLAVLVLLVLAQHIIIRRFLSSHYRSVVIATLIGITLRIVYMMTTPYHARGYDTDDHIAYADFLLDHLRLPLRGELWEWYHPPLYYIFLTPFVGIGRVLSLNDAHTTFLIQLSSLALSIGVLCIGAWIALRLFSVTKHRHMAALATLLLATFPSLVFFASRINNDVLVHFGTALTLAFVVHWWQTGVWRSFYASVVVIGLSLLVKNNALLLLPVALGCLAVRRGIPLGKKCRVASISLAIVAILAGWHTVHRMVTDDSVSLVGNIDALHSGLQLENTTKHLTVFNPIEVIDHPFNNPWIDEQRRQYFWEYWYRSALFGEFSFVNTITVSRTMLALGFLMVLMALFGIVHSARSSLYDHLPLLLTLVLVIAGHFMFRLRYPYASSQDFRYSITALFPFAIFAVQSLCIHTRMRSLGTVLVLAFCSVCSVFLLFASAS